MESSNIIILAAGEGKRLLPLTKNSPKCLVKIFGKRIIDWQIDVYKFFKINNISIVTGYQSKKIKIANVDTFFNPKYESTNMVETLFCAKEKMINSTIISYGDIIFQRNIFKKLYESKSDISVIVDKNWLSLWKLRFKNPLDDAESLKIDHDGYITSIGSKVEHLHDIQGQYIGLMKFQNDGLTELKNFYKKMKILSKIGKNPLNDSLPFQQSYMTDLLQGMINNGFKIKSIPINGGWLEVDTYSDLMKYELLLKNKTLTNFFKI